MNWFLAYWLFGFAGCLVYSVLLDWSMAKMSNETFPGPRFTPLGMVAAIFGALLGPLLWIAAIVFLLAGLCAWLFGHDFWTRPIFTRKR